MSPRTESRIGRANGVQAVPIRSAEGPAVARADRAPTSNRALTELYRTGQAPPGRGPMPPTIDREPDAGVPAAQEISDGGLPGGVPMAADQAVGDSTGALPISPADAELLARQLPLVADLVASGQVELPPDQKENLALASGALQLASQIAADGAQGGSKDDLARRAALYAAIGAVFGSIIRVFIYMEGKGFPMLLPATGRSLAQTPVNYAIDFSVAYSGSGDTGLVQGQAQHVATVTGGAAAHNAIMVGLQRLGLSGAGRLTVPVSLVWTQLPMALVGTGLQAATNAGLKLRSEMTGEPIDPIESAAAKAATTGLTVSVVAGTAEAIKAGAEVAAQRAGRPVGKDPAFGEGTVKAIRSLIKDPRKALTRAAATVKRTLKNIGPTLKKAVGYAKLGARVGRTWIVALITFVLPAVQDFIARFRTELGEDDQQRVMDVLMAMLEGRSAPSAAQLGEATASERELANYDQETLIKETVSLIDRVIRLPGAADDLSIYGIEAIRRKMPILSGPMTALPRLLTLGESDQEVILRAEQAWKDFGDSAWDILEILGRMAAVAGISLTELVTELLQGVATDASRPSAFEAGFCSPDGATGVAPVE